MLVESSATPIGRHCPVAWLLRGNDTRAVPCMLQANLHIKRCLNNLDFALHGLEVYAHFLFTAEVSERLYTSTFLQAPQPGGGENACVSPSSHWKSQLCEGWTSFLWVKICCSIWKEQIRSLFTGTSKSYFCSLLHVFASCFTATCSLLWQHFGGGE